MKIIFSLLYLLSINLSDYLVQSQSAEIWLSQPIQNLMLYQIPNEQFQDDSGTAVIYTIDINESQRYQKMDGFGASLTDASTWLLKYKLTNDKRGEILSRLFSSQGINLSLLRQPIGSSDFNWEAWSFADTSSNRDDFSLTSFALWREDDYIWPMLSQALQVSSGRVKLFASPWSPPAW
jgi:glucosylceramidase